MDDVVPFAKIRQYDVANLCRSVLPAKNDTIPIARDERQHAVTSCPKRDALSLIEQADYLRNKDLVGDVYFSHDSLVYPDRRGADLGGFGVW